MTLDRRSRAGFSLVELAVTLTILAVMVGIVSLRAERVGDVEVRKLLGLLDSLEKACALHLEDTGSYAHEYAGYGDVDRQLSANQSAPGWNGPYLDTALEHRLSNPYGSLHLYSSVQVNGWVPGFDVDGDGVLDVTSAGNMLWLSGVTAEAARLLDEKIDGELEDADSWSDSGRFRYGTDQKYAWALVHH